MDVDDLGGTVREAARVLGRVGASAYASPKAWPIGSQVTGFRAVAAGRSNRRP